MSDGTTLDILRRLKALEDGQLFVERGREVLTANRTYYVSPSGSDANDGLSASTPLATIQKAVDVVSQTLDLAGYTVTIQLANGTHTLTDSVAIRNFVGGSGLVIIQGDTTTPSNVVISQSTSGKPAFDISDNARLVTLRGFRLTGTGSNAAAIQCGARGRAAIANIEFNTGWSVHLYATQGSYLSVSGNYSVLAGATYHIASDYKSLLVTTNITVTLVGTPAFTVWAYAFGLSMIAAQGQTFSGGASAGTQRYNVALNAAIWTNGGGATYFPGGAAGAPATGGQYA